MKVYLDIETSFNGEITVIGLYNSREKTFDQLYDDKINPLELRRSLGKAQAIMTYNGSRFDLPVIKKELEIDLSKEYFCHDLMYDCWELNLYGGLKKVEEELGIERRLKGISGYDAMLLWSRYKDNDDREALRVLLKYNREDVLNLPMLEMRLHSFFRFDNIPLKYDI